MPRFEGVQPRGGLPAAMPIPQVSPGAFGAGTSRALARLGGVLTDLGADRLAETQTLRREREIAERSTSLARRLQDARDQMRRLTDPDAVEQLRDEVLRDLDGEIGEAGDRVVQDTLRRHASTWGTAFAGAAADHLFAIERDRGRAAVRDALETRKALAVSATTPAERLLAEREYDAIAGEAVDRGLFTAEELTVQRRADRSHMHVLTLEGMLDRGQDQGAAAYLADPTVRGELLAEDLVKADKMTAAGTFLGRVQRHEDAIYAKHLHDREGALAEARQIPDAEERKATVQALTVRYDEARRIQAEAQEDALKTASNLIDGGGRVDQIPANVRAQLSISQIEMLRKVEADRRRGTPIQTDWGLYYDLKTQAAAPELRERFLKTNLYALKDRLADTEFKEVTSLQAGLRAKDATAEAAVTGYRTEQQIVNDSLAAAGFDPTPEADSDDATQVARFRRLVDEDIADHVARTGKRPTTTDVQAIVDRLLIKGPRPGTGWFGSEVGREEGFAFQLEPGQTLALTPADIPPRERRLMEDALRRAGIPVTDAILLDLFNARLQESVGRGR